MLGAALLLLPAVGQAQTSGDFNYSVDNGAIWITEYIGAGGEVSIPGSIYVPALTNSLPVVGIGGRQSGDAWRGAFWLSTSVTIYPRINNST